MSDLAWVVVAIVAGTIALEIWIANKRLNVEMARMQLWVRDEEDED